ncbi:hypothetical protein U0070_014733 [Myodes glareolus]|uniref:Myb/SANT-like DNA-binding domain-containing protein n=1 Tax=Myodes glareolus TaxID=447135 RepID=A0AAW0HWH6_MYOGA
MPPPFSARGSGAPGPRQSPPEGSGRQQRARGVKWRSAGHSSPPDTSSAPSAGSEPHSPEPGPRATPESAVAGCAAASLPGGAAAAAWKMAAPCGSELPANSPLKIPKMEVLSPASPGDLSDGNPSLSDPSTPRGASPLGPGSAAGSGTAASGGLGLGLGGRSAASSSVSFSPGGGSGGAAAAAAAACRGMSWTPAETNALIAVWGNERLVEARYQQLEGAGTVFGSKAPGPAMYERVSRALAELGYERTPSQCRERIKAFVSVFADKELWFSYVLYLVLESTKIMRRQSKAKEIEPLKNLEDQFTCFQTELLQHDMKAQILQWNAWLSEGRVKGSSRKKKGDWKQTGGQVMYQGSGAFSV